MKEKVIRVLALAGLCLFLAGCGKKQEGVWLLADETQGAGEAGEEGTEERKGSEPQTADQTGGADGTGGAGETAVSGAASDAQESDAGAGTVYIYICGEVQNPGVYELARGKRICDAVEAAGGLTEAAAGDYWNLAQVLTDGQMIYVPTKEQAAERVLPEDAAGMGVSASGGQQEDERININTAAKEQLMELPGIGEAKAESILAYRKEHGDFSTPEELMNVPGIKENLFQKVEEHIRIR